MEIIPVIDLMGGIVVQASGGDRHNYPPLKSIITQHTDPLQVITDLRSICPFKTVYLADLDAIFHQRLDLVLYQQLANSFPDVLFWLDAGITVQQDWYSLDEFMGINPIIASESLQDLELLTSNKQSVLSLDFQGGKFLGKRGLLHQPKLWPENVIVMDLDSVGSGSGPDVGLLQEIQRKRPDVNIIAAGGIRNQQDLVVLRKMGINSVLVASALHSGNLELG